MLFIPRHDASAHQRNLSRLCLLRTILLAGLLLALGVAEWGLSVPVFADATIIFSLLLLTIFNGWTLWRVQRRVAVSDTELCVQLGVDVALMTLILYRTGGATNPFVSWYLVPLTIAAATLRTRYTLLLVLITLLAYSVLLFHYVPFSPFDGAQMATQAVPQIADHSHAAHRAMRHAGHADTSTSVNESFNLHVFGMWLNFMSSAGLIAFFVSRMSHALREQDKQLAEQRERLLQREQVVSLGALAAGAAHELGTPLSTMLVIARDIEQDLPDDSPLREDVVMLQKQLTLCRTVLQGLREQASGAGAPATLHGLINAAVERMEIIHPRCQFVLENLSDKVAIKAPSTLLQALVSLLDNAAQAAKQQVQLTVLRDESMCIIDICDDGAGIDPEVAARLGQPFVTSKEDGMGIGYFLSHASINTLGGRIEIVPLPDGGTRTRLALPWRALGVFESINV